MQMRKPAASFLKVKRKETQAAAVPSTTNVKIGIPARESVSKTETVARPRQNTASERTYRGNREAAAATKTGAHMQRYMDKLLAWSKVPVTRSTWPRKRSLSA